MTSDAIVPTPDACQFCGREKRAHSLEWDEKVGYHYWVQPTTTQRKERMFQRHSLLKR